MSSPLIDAVIVVVYVSNDSANAYLITVLTRKEAEMEDLIV